MIDFSMTAVMGVLNVTPDSFSDGGRYYHAHQNTDDAVAQAIKMLEEGACIIDIGGESTRPGAASVSLEQELERVIPVITAVRNACPQAIISIDTSKAEVMRQAVYAGAHIINDVNALRGEYCLSTVADLGVPVCLMHMKGDPKTMQNAPSYDNVVEEVYDFLEHRIQACFDAGIAKNNLLLDVGFGFGKTLEDNLLLLKHLDQFLGLECPLLVGMSRKSMVGTVTGRAVDDRLAGSLAVATIAAIKGAQIIRVHDVKETVDAIKMVSAVESI